MSGLRERLTALAQDFDIRADNVQRERDPSGDVAGAWRAAADAARDFIVSMDAALLAAPAPETAPDKRVQIISGLRDMALAQLPAPDAPAVGVPPLQGGCHEHGVVEVRWIEGAHRCEVCGEPTTAVAYTGAEAAFAAPLSDAPAAGVGAKIIDAVNYFAARVAMHGSTKGDREVLYAAITAALRSAEARGGEMERQRVSRFAKYIVNAHNVHTRTDHACEQCIGDGPIVIPGFICAYHEALALTTPPTPGA